jgi:hypothetical protein
MAKSVETSVVIRMITSSVKEGEVAVRAAMESMAREGAKTQATIMSVTEQAGRAARKQAAETDRVRRSYEDLASRLDPVIGKQLALAKATETLAKAEKAGLVSSEERSRYLKLAQTEFGATSEGARGLARNVLSTVAPWLSLFGAVQLGSSALRQARDEAQQLRSTNAQLEAGLKSTGNQVGYTVTQLGEMARGLEDVSTADDATIGGALSVLLTFTKIGHDAFPQAAQAALDLSTRMGGDLSSAAVQVGKALQDPVNGITALKKQGISFAAEQQTVIERLVKTGDVAGAQAVILKELSVEVGGSAAAARAAAGGVFELGKAGEDSSKLIGAQLLPVLDELGASLASRLPAATEVFLGAFRGVSDVLTTVPGKIAAVSLGLAGMQGAFTVVTAFVAANPFGALALGIGAVGLALNALVTRWGAASSAAIDNDVAVTNAAGSIVGLAQAAKAGAPVTQALFDQAKAGADKLRTSVEAVTKRLADLREERARMASAFGEGSVEVGRVDIQINASSEELRSLQTNLNNLSGLLRQVKVDAGAVGAAMMGPGSPSEGFRELTKDLESQIAEQQKLRSAWAQGQGAGDRMAREVAIAREVAEATKGLTESEAGYVESLIRRRAALEGQVAAEREHQELVKQTAADFKALEERLDPAVAAQRRFDEGFTKLTAQLAAGELPLERYLLLTAKLRDELYPDTAGQGNSLADELARLRAEQLRGAIDASNPGDALQGGGFGAKILAELRERQKLEEKAKKTGEDRLKDQRKEIDNWYALGQIVADAFSTMDEGLGRAIGQSAALAANIADAYASWKASGGKNGYSAEGVAGGMQTGQQVGSLGEQFGAWQGQRGAGQYGGTLSGDYGSTGSMVGGAIGSYFGPVGGLIGSLLGGVIGGAIKTGADEGLGQLRDIGNDVALRITSDEGGLGSVVARIGNAIASGLGRISEVTGGLFANIPDIDIKVRDDVVSIFVNGIVRRFKDVNEAIAFGINEALRSADTSGLSDNQQQILRYAAARNAASQAGGLASEVSLDDVTKGLDFAKLVDRMGLGSIGTKLANDIETTRRQLADAIKYGFATEEIQKIKDQLVGSFRDVREGLSTELANLSGTSTQAGDAVLGWSKHVDDLLKGIREYNAALTQQAAKERERVAAIHAEIAAQTQAAAAARANAARLLAESPDPATGGHGGPRTPGGGAGDDGSPGTGTGTGPTPYQEQILAAQAADEAIRQLTAELDGLGATSEQTAIDVNTSILALIHGSSRIFDDFTAQFLDGPVEAFNRQIEQFGEYRDAASDVYDENLRIAETDEQRSAAATELQHSLDELAAAQDAYLKSVADTAQLDLFSGLAGLLAEGPQKEEAMRRSAELRYDLARAELRLKYEELKLANEKYKAEHDGVQLIAQSTLDWINDTLNSLPEDKGTGDGGGDSGNGSGGGRGGGGRRDARENLLGQLSDAMRGPLGTWQKQVADWKQQTEDWLKEAKRLGISLDDVRKASEEVRKRMAADAQAQIDQMIHPSSSAGKQVIDLKKWRADLDKVAKELGLSGAEIAQAYRAQFRRIVAEVRQGVAEYANVFGEGGLKIALLDNARQADDLRHSLEDLKKENPLLDITADMEAVNEAERERARLLTQQAKIGALEGLDKWVDDARLSTELTKLKGQLEIEQLRAQIEGLIVAGRLDAEHQALYLGWLDEAERKIREAYNDPPPGDPPPPIDTSGVEEQIAGIFDPTGGLRGRIGQMRKDFDGIQKAIKDLHLPTAEETRLLAELDGQMARSREAAGLEETAGLFEGIAQYLQDGTEKEELLRRAAEIRFDMERASMQARLDLLVAEHLITTENQALIQKGLDWMLEHRDEILSGFGSSGGSGGGGGGSSNYDDAQGLIDSLRGMLTSDLPDVQQRFADLDLEFERIREQAAALNLDRLLGPGGGAALIDEAYAARIRALWDEILQPLDEFVHGLDLSALSPLTPQQRLAEAASQFNTTAQAALAGDATAASQLAQMAQQYLQEAQGLGTSTAAYQAIYAQVLAISQQVLAMHAGVTTVPTPIGAPAGGGPGSNVLLFPSLPAGSSSPTSVAAGYELSMRTDGAITAAINRFANQNHEDLRDVRGVLVDIRGVLQASTANRNSAHDRLIGGVQQVGLRGRR